jgi:hypothetical protein
MDMENQRRLVEAQHQSYNSRNLDSFCSCFHPDVIVERIGKEDKQIGLENLRNGFKKLFDSSPNLYCEVKSRIYLKDSVIDEEFVTGASNYPDGLHGVAVYQFKDNLIYRMSFAL